MSKQINLNTYYYKKSDIHDFLENKANLVHVHGNITNDGKVGTTANKPLITGTNGVIQASSFGTTANTFCQGNDSRLSDARTPKSHTHKKAEISDFPTSMTPTSHTHGNITNAGAIGSTANLPVITTTSGKLTTGSFGTGANTFCQGNDPRLSDARTPKFIDIGASSTNTKNLDNFTTGGFYYYGNDNNAQYISNCPKTGTNNKSFFLLVETWNGPYYVKQTLTYYNNQKTYIRTKVNTNWSPWHLVKTTEESVSSTHTTSTSAWTGKSENLVSLEAGTVIYYWLKQAPTTDNVTLDLTLANGDTTGAKNVYFGNSVRLTNQFKAWTIIGLFWDGYNWFVINPYNDNYIKNTNGAVLNANIGNNQVNNAKLSDNSVSTSKIQNGAVTNDKINPMIFRGNGTGATAGYIKMIKFVISEAWKDKPITFDLYNRARKDNIHVSLKFKNDSGIDPGVDYFSYTSYDAVNLYIYKEKASTWSIIISKEANGNFEIANLIIPNYEISAITYANMNTQISALPSNTSTNPLIQATQRTYGGISNNNITAPAFIKSGGTSSQFLKANGDVGTVVNDLSTGGTGNVLSAEQGKVLNNKLDAMQTVATGTITGFNSAYNASGSVSYIKYNGWVVINYYNFKIQNKPTHIEMYPLFNLPYDSLKRNISNYYFNTIDGGNLYPTDNIQVNVAYSGVYMYPTSD